MNTSSIEASQPTAISSNQLAIPKPVSSLDKKFNVVTYGIKESLPTQADMTIRNMILMKVFSELQLTVTSDSIKDFHRLGKYDQHMKHP